MADSVVGLVWVVLVVVLVVRVVGNDVVDSRHIRSAIYQQANMN